MKCPICGETLPLSSNVCASCGNEYDGFFLTEEVKSSALRRSVAESKAPRQPAALKPRNRAPLSSRTIWIIVVSVAAAIIAVAAVLVFVPRGKTAAGNPAAAVNLYYQYLQKGDSEGLFSLFDPGFLPMEGARASIKAALSTNKYAVTGPATRVMSSDNNTALVAIDSLQVQVTSGGNTRTLTLADRLQSLIGSQTGKSLVVRINNSGSGWKISGRPLNGWTVEDIWLVGTLQ
ncbi:MAG TPA: hypothetical protein VIJ97_08330 [Candidatus Anoxymicrobiaceae bacterium]